eukprot:7378473-Prymnesium_polylepis.1
MSVGTPTIGDAYHVSTKTIVKSAAQAGLINDTMAELTLPGDIPDLLAKVTMALTEKHLWLSLQKQAAIPHKAVQP